MKFINIDVKKLLQLMEEYDIAEMNLRDGKSAVEVVRKRSVAGYVTSAQAPSVQSQETPAPAAPVVQDQQTEELAVPSKYYSIKAPLVGTLYLAPSPDTDPFVQIGDKIRKGQVICIVEAMKSMNEIQSDVSGVVKEICASNAELVEFDQVLFNIDTNA